MAMDWYHECLECGDFYNPHNRIGVCETCNPELAKGLPPKKFSTAARSYGVSFSRQKSTVKADKWSVLSAHLPNKIPVRAVNQLSAGVLVVLGLLVIFLAFFVASPYLAVMNLRSDIESRDGESLAERIDFASVRESFKDQFNVAMAKTVMNTSDQDDPLVAAGSAMGAAIASAIVDGMVNKLVTPSGLIELVSSGEVSVGSDNKTQGEKDQEPSISDVILSYEAINKFSATLLHEDGREVKLILRRQGLSWVVTDIKLPLEDS